MGKKADIRKAVADELRSLDIFNAVFPFRASNVPADKCPLALIYIEGGSEEFDSDGVYDTTGSVSIEIIVTGTGDLEAELDALADQVNQKLDIDNTLNGLVSGFYRVGFVYDHEPEALSASFTQTYNIQFED